MNLRTLFTVALLCLGSAGSALCSTLKVTESGVFSSTTPATPLATPGGSYSFSFLLDSSPNVKTYSATYTSPVFQNLQYNLNGAAFTPSFSMLQFFSSDNGGGFALTFNDSSGHHSSFNFQGDAFYTGSGANPLFQPGTFSLRYGNYTGDIQSDNLSAYSDATVAAVATTPEPSSLLLLSTGVLGVAGVLRRKLA